jgi:hypothetical protein
MRLELMKIKSADNTKKNGVWVKCFLFCYQPFIILSNITFFCIGIFLSQRNECLTLHVKFELL